MMNLMSEFAELHDDTLLSQLDDLVRRDRGSCARIIAHVAEVDARKLYLDRGAPSMIDYAKRVLGFSDSAAYRRVTAARLVRRFPLLLDRIASGAVHLTALTILGPHLDEENCERLVAAASGKSRLELEALVAPFRAPVPVTPRAVVRVVRMAEAAGTDPKAAGSAAAPPTPPRLAHRLSATLSPETKALLDRAAELHRRDIRPGDVDALLQRALRLLVDTTEARRFGKVRRPRATRPQSPRPRAPRPGSSAAPATGPSPASRACRFESVSTPPATAGSSRVPGRAIPAVVRRAVAERDGHRCTFVAADGRRCLERGALEFHHRQPFAHGGAATAENLTLLCSAHHRRVSEQQFGKFLVRDEPRGGTGYGNSRQARVTGRPVKVWGRGREQCPLAPRASTHSCRAAGRCLRRPHEPESILARAQMLC
jgi:5-methylcytosine-specific restriction endonuclease McrA